MSDLSDILLFMRQAIRPAKIGRRPIMIKNSKQNWEIGQRVKVGFMSLTVIQKESTPGDYAPDAYFLKSDNGSFYTFVPHNGLMRVDEVEQIKYLDSLQ